MLKIQNVSIQQHFTSDEVIPEDEFIKIEDHLYKETAAMLKGIKHTLIYRDVSEPEYYVERGTSGGLIICKVKCVHTWFGEILDRLGLKKYYLMFMENFF